MSNVRDDFLRLLRGAVALRLPAVQAQLDDAIRAGDDITEARAAWLELRGLESSIQPPPEGATDAEARAHLVTQWPASLPALPLSFRDPVEAARRDPPGKPCVVRCSEP